jgi:DNA-binding NarL/FixJ family response regulator
VCSPSLGAGRSAAIGLPSTTIGVRTPGIVPALAKALGSVLQDAGGFEMARVCNTLAVLQTEMARCKPDLALLELSSEMTFAVLSAMRRESDAKLVLWVNAISTDVAFHAMEMGIRGILRKNLPPQLQVKCLQTVQAGQPWFEKTLIDSALAPRAAALTPQEGQLVELLTQGLKNQEIGRELLMTEPMVSASLSRLFRKIGVKDRFELALFGLKNMSLGRRSGDGILSGEQGDIEAIA